MSLQRIANLLLIHNRVIQFHKTLIFTKPNHWSMNSSVRVRENNKWNQKWNHWSSECKTCTFKPCSSQSLKASKKNNSSWPSINPLWLIFLLHFAFALISLIAGFTMSLSPLVIYFQTSFLTFSFHSFCSGFGISHCLDKENSVCGLCTSKIYPSYPVPQIVNSW